jgi:single-strand DNA-binding protein
MQGLNRAYFIGRIGRDPEVRTSPNKGVVVATVSLATSNRRKGEDGTWTDHPDWPRLTAFGATAGYLQRSDHKGDGIAVECAVRQEKWTDKEGATHYDTRLLVDRVLWVVPKLVRTVEGTQDAPNLASSDAEPSSPANVGPIRVAAESRQSEEQSEEPPF